MTTYRAPSPPYAGPAAHHGPATNKPINRIVIHSTVSPCEPGGARNIAAMFRSTDRDASAHYVVDPEETVQVVYDSIVAYHAPPNEHSIGVELCDMPHPTDPRRWQDENHQAMLIRAARLVARLCLAYDVPRVFLDVDALKAGHHGITTHNNVSQAFHQTTHWDPGAWPRDHFMELVEARADRIIRRNR